MDFASQPPAIRERMMVGMIQMCVEPFSSDSLSSVLVGAGVAVDCEVAVGNSVGSAAAAGGR